MQPDLRKYLADIQQALSELQEFKGKTLADYQAEVLVRRGIEREFIIIGEVMARIIHRFPESRSRIDHARRIANFRNLLVHEYGDIDDAVVWDILIHSVPILQIQVDDWIGELDRS